MDNLDNDTICETMLKLELITERDVMDSAKMYSEYQKNSFLLDQLLTSDASCIVEFCYVLQSAQNKQEIGKMLMNGKEHEVFLIFLLLSIIAIELISTNDTDTGTGTQSSDITSYPIITEENDTDVGHVHQPEVFLTAKTVHIRFLNLFIQIKQMLKDCNPQCLLEALKKLRAYTRTEIHSKIIPLLSSDFLEEFKNNNSEEVLRRSAFLWSWNNNSILRALLEACNCQTGIKMLDEFECQIDTNQPMELFPIPRPSAKMTPSSSSAYTVLSIRCEYDQNELTSLQYVNDVAKIMIEKFGFSQHSLQLLATRTSPLMLYWVIPKIIMPFINKEVKNHLDFLKAKGFSEIAIYPSTILFSNSNLNHGSFALLASQSQVRYF